MSKVLMNPTPFLRYLQGKKIIVRLKWGLEYEGQLACADAYMNLELNDVEEFIEGVSQGMMEKLLIRCNNILYVREKEVKGNGDNTKDDDDDDDATKDS